MEVIYCSKCGEQIPPGGINDGLFYRLGSSEDSDIVCPECYKAFATGDHTGDTVMELQNVRRKPRTSQLAIEPARRRSRTSTHRLPAAARSPSSARHARVGGGGPTILWAGLGIALLAAMCCTAFLMGRRDAGDAASTRPDRSPVGTPPYRPLKENPVPVVSPRPTPTPEPTPRPSPQPAPTTPEAVPPGAVRVVLQDGLNGYSGTRDVSIQHKNRETNRGKHASLLSFGPTGKKGSLPLIRFAIFAAEGGPVPDRSEIVSATLQLYGKPNRVSYALHRVLKPWKEEEATWLLAAKGAAWSKQGAAKPGEDISEKPDALAKGKGKHPQWLSFDVTAAVLAFAAGEENCGWKLHRLTQHMLSPFRSRESQENKPRLIIVHRPPDGKK
jgi:hypothetical protein